MIYYSDHACKILYLMLKTASSFKHIMKPHCILISVLIFLRYPGPPAAQSAPYGQPPQSPYSMASQAPPPAQQLTNQMTAMNLGNYGQFAMIYTCYRSYSWVWHS